MNGITAVIGRIDRFQQSRTPLAMAWGVNKKYSDDRGNYLAALIAYYGLLSIFPLLLVFFSVAIFLLSPGSPTLHDLITHLSRVPIVGNSLGDVEKGRLNGSVVAIVIGLAGLTWGAQGLAQTMQYAMNQVWNVPHKARAGFVPRLLTTAKWYVTFGVGIGASTYLSSLSAVFDLGPFGWLLAALPALVVNCGLFLLSFRILSPSEISLRQLRRGALAAGVAWTFLTTIGVGLVTGQLSHSSALYGSLGTVLGILGFIYLTARVTLYCAEYNVVRDRHLWPRALVGPSLSTADKQQLMDMAKREERIEDETVRVEF